MKYKLGSSIGMSTPSDGLDDTEKELKRTIEVEALRTLYNKLPTNRMRFVVAAHYELGYPQEFVAEILGITQPSLQDEISHIRRVLKGDPYKPYKKKASIKVADLMQWCLLMKQE